MKLVDNLVINLYSIVLLFIIYFQSLKQVDKDSLQHKIFITMLKVALLLLSMDIFSRFDSKPDTIYYFINRWGNFAIFLLNPIMPSLWLLYVYVQVFREEDKIKKVFYSLTVLNFVNAILVVLTHFFGWFYYFDSGNIYHRGPLYWIPVTFTAVLLLFSYFIIINNKKKMEKKQCITLAVFAIPPSIGIFLQILFYGIQIVLNCMVLSLLIVFLNIQNRNMYTDYLTGVNNRKKLDTYLRNKIRTSTVDNTFAAIMLDLNDFKNINDTWGHDAGDEALKITIKLLNSCLRENDFIARFGGDEFCIVLERTGKNELEEIVKRIKNSFTKYNETSGQPYELSISIGYAIYDYHSSLNLEEFQKKLDILMYENKQSIKRD